MSLRSPRRRRESRTIAVMIEMYCRGNHHQQPLCTACRELQSYAAARLEDCPFQESKPTCVKCPVHCYRAEMRERVRAVMRYAGPKMLFSHPWLALRHIIDGRRRKPVKPVQK